jgi:hypothetical protein
MKSTWNSDIQGFVASLVQRERVAVGDAMQGHVHDADMSRWYCRMVETEA